MARLAIVLAKCCLSAGALRLLTQHTRRFARLMFCRYAIPFAFPDRRRLRNGYKRRRRRGPEGVARSTSFTPQGVGSSLVACAAAQEQTTP